MTKENRKKKIKCDVETCSFNNCQDNCCTLDEIKVSCSCCGNEVTDKTETICDSFKESSE